MSKALQLASRAALLNVAYRAVLRPRLASWGATDEETRASLPGDDILPVGAATTTMGTTIDAPPADVWPWLVQMGCDRAGWYSHDLLDNAGRPSAEKIVAEWQRISLGDRMSADPSGKKRVWFTIEGVYPEHALILRAPIDLSTGHPYDLGAPRPPAFSDSTWALVLRELPGHRTRLLARTRTEVDPVWRALPMSLVVGLPSHVIMQLRQFRNLKRRAERPRRQADRQPAMAVTPVEVTLAERAPVG
jgi:proline iminopeptidase